jgi:predicted nuclease with RNAse H fold
MPLDDETIIGAATDGSNAPTWIVGIDLSGPSNSNDTAMAQFRVAGVQLNLVDARAGVDDDTILKTVLELASQGTAAVGLDAPLSYQNGGGDRPRDSKLRKRLIECGLPPGCVMPPTLNKMAYLTLRGLAVARSLGTIQTNPPRIVEVHPTGCMALRGADVNLVRELKRDANAGRELLTWLEAQGLGGVNKMVTVNAHTVAACAAALAAWKWSLAAPAWIEPAAPPFHPFDFAC